MLAKLFELRCDGRRKFRLKAVGDHRAACRRAQVEV
jgi:hypothetical protein